LIDKQDELVRLDKEIQRIKADLSRVENKLNNSAFVDKAPRQIIEKEQAKLAEMHSQLIKLEQQYVRITAL